MFLLLLVGYQAYAAVGTTTYQAKIIKPDGYPLEASAVNFRFTILNPAGTCIVYVENYSAVNMNNSGGLISFSLGSGIKSFPSSATTFADVFSNSVAALTCAAGGPAMYNPGSSDTRKIVMQFQDSAGWQTLPAMNINAVPYAMYASNSESLNGKLDSDFVQVTSIPTCVASQALFYNGTQFSCVTAGGTLPPALTSSDVTTALGYDPVSPVSYTTVSAEVSSLGTSFTQISNTLSGLGSLAFASSLDLGSASATGIISDLRLANMPQIISGTQFSKVIVDSKGRVVSGSQLTASELTSTLGISSCGANQYLTFNGTSYSCVADAGASGTITTISVTGPLSSTAGSNPVLSINYSSDFTLSGAALNLTTTGVVPGSYVKMTVDSRGRVVSSSALTLADVTTALGYTPASATALSNYLQIANNLSDLSSSSSARINLGLGSFATANSLDLGSASATGVISDARLANITNVTSGTQYTKVTVDGKGRVISGAQLSSSDVNTALGYTPAASGSFVSSQWNTSGTTIHYNLGNVGIGTVNPAYKLEVVGITNAQLFQVGNVGTDGIVSLRRSSDGAIAGQLALFGSELRLNASGYSTFYSGGGTEQMRITSTGQIGIGTSAPTAKLHLAAGTNSLAPFKLTSGTLLTSPQSGSVEYDGFNYYITDGSNLRRSIATLAAPGTFDNTNLISNFSGNIILSPNSTTGSVVVSATTASTNSNTGALISKGGLGVAGDANIGGGLVVSGAATAAGLKVNGAYGAMDLISANSMVFGANGVSPNAASVAWGDNTGWKLNFGTSVAGIFTPRVSVLDTGNVGIGTEVPTGLLSLFKEQDSVTSIVVQNPSSGSSAMTRLNLGSDGGKSASLQMNSLNFSGNAYQGQASGLGIWTSMNASGGITLSARHTQAPIRFLNNDSERMRITAGGSVGIGTSSPATLLELNGGAGKAALTITADTDNSIETDNAYIHFKQDGNLIDAYIGLTGLDEIAFGVLPVSYSLGNSFLIHSTSSPVQLAVGEAAHLTVGTNGRVGIGTDSPTVKLEVSGTILSSSGLVHSYTNTPGANPHVTVAAGPNASFPVFQLNDQRSGARSFNIENGRLASGTFAIRDNAASIERLTINSSGNVGIGTGTPNAPLDVNGSIISRPPSANNGAIGIITSGTSIAVAGNAGWFLRGNHPTTPYNSNLGGSLAYEYWNGASVVQAMAITSSGALGLGTKTPLGTLDVRGDITRSSASFYISGDTNTYYPAVFSAALNHSSEFEFEVIHNVHEDFQSSGSLFFSVNGNLSGYGGSLANYSAKIIQNHFGFNKYSLDEMYLDPYGSYIVLYLLGGRTYHYRSKTAAIRFIQAENEAFSQCYNACAVSFNTPAPYTTNTGSLNRSLVEVNTRNIGFGTASPRARFEVMSNNNIYGGIASTPTTVFADTQTNANLVVGLNGTTSNSLQSRNSTAASWPLALNPFGGNVGVGLVNPDDRFVVYNGSTTGRYTTGGWTHTSDARFKNSIKPLENSLQKVIQLNGVSYQYNNDASKKTQIGLIAQHVEPIFPEVVETDKKGFKSMIYANLVAPIIEAIKELFEKITHHDREIASLKEDVQKKDQQIKALQNYICGKDPTAEICKP